jgi:hypothetical protein
MPAPQLVALAVVSLLGLLTMPARAEEFTRRNLTLPDGAFEITGQPARPKIFAIDLSEDSAGEPIYTNPHFYWGVTDDLTIGITHELGICMTGDAGGCPRVYNDVGFGLLYNLTRSDVFQLALHVGAPISNFDPFFLGARVGVLGKVTAGVLGFVFDPYLHMGFTNRDEGGLVPDDIGGPFGRNREYVVLPAWFYFQATDVVVPFVGIVFSIPLNEFDNTRIPLEGGMVFDVAQNVDIGFVFRFNNLFGEDGSADWREIGFMGRFQF